MKALVYVGPQQLELREVSPPECLEGQCVVKVEYCGICGSDMHAWAGHDTRRPAPLILGHEVAGVVIDDLSLGQLLGKRVTVNPLVACGLCAACNSGHDNLCAQRQIISMPPREGGFAERLAMPVKNLVIVPEHVHADKAALTEPLACGWHAVRLAQQVLRISLKEAKCLVIGGGAIGLGAALILDTQKAGEIWLAETNAARRAVIEQLGNLNVFDPTSNNGPESPDLVIDGVGIEPTRAQASGIVKPGGVIVHIGLGSANCGLDVRRMTLQEITFIGSYTYSAQDFRDTAQSIFDGRLGPLNWHETRPLSDGAQAFEDIRAGHAAAPKILLKP